MNELLRSDILFEDFTCVVRYNLRRQVQFTGQFKVCGLRLAVFNSRPCYL